MSLDLRSKSDRPRPGSRRTFLQLKLLVGRRRHRLNDKSCIASHKCEINAAPVAVLPESEPRNVG
jgi:hypothetical protein